MVTIRHSREHVGHDPAMEQTLQDPVLEVFGPEQPQARATIKGVNAWGHTVLIRLDGPTLVDLFGRLGANPETADIRAGKLAAPPVPQTRIIVTQEPKRPRKRR